jgi:hypothetical protein
LKLQPHLNFKGYGQYGKRSEKTPGTSRLEDFSSKLTTIFFVVIYDIAVENELDFATALNKRWRKSAFCAMNEITERSAPWKLAGVDDEAT